MSGSDDSGDKTEEPTQKKLRDARKKGDVPKSKELTGTMTLLCWLALSGAALPYVGARLALLLEQAIAVIGQDFSYSAPVIGWMAFETTCLVTAIMFLPIIFIGVMTEFLQAGPVLSFDKVTPKMENLDPVQRIKQWFSADQAMELFKSAVKAILMLIIAWLVLRRELANFALLPTATPAHVLKALLDVGLKLLMWTVGAFLFISILDVFWTRHSFTKKQRMSMKDIRDEHKENEGDPHVKAARQRLHRELVEQKQRKMTASATALVVNPTHISVAIHYNKDKHPLPLITAIGTDDFAMEMRRAAEAANIPMVRNVPLARALLADGLEGDSVPERHFEIVAEVILWAKQARADIDESLGKRNAPEVKRRFAPPGEDVTNYPRAETAFKQSPTEPPPQSPTPN